MSRGSANTVSRGIPGAGIFGGEQDKNGTNQTQIECQEDPFSAAGIIFLVSGLGMSANLFVMMIIMSRKRLRRWSQGLLFHQAMVDCARAAILMPLGTSILHCRPVNKCSLVETAFLLLVTVSTVNLLTTVLNDSPVLPDDDEEDAVHMLMDSPQCVIFGMFMIWFSSITINLGPTFLSGALAANSEIHLNKPSCPLIQGPFRHYVLNVLWIFINLLCVLLTMYHLYKLYKDFSKSNFEAVRVASLVTTLISVNQQSPDEQPPNGGLRNMGDMSMPAVMDYSNNSPHNNHNNHHSNHHGGGNSDSQRIKTYLAKMEREGLARVKMFVVITVAYLIFWGPLFLVTLFSYGDYKTETPSTSHEVTLHVAFVHAFVNPTLFLVLHKGLRKATMDLICCNFRSSGSGSDDDEEIEGARGGEVFPLPPPPLNGSGRNAYVDGVPGSLGAVNRTYMLSDARSDSTGSKKETTL